MTGSITRVAKRSAGRPADRWRRARRALVSVTAAIGVTVGSAVAPAHASTNAAGHAAVEEYVALGDSYASGLGAGSYLADGTSCSRSATAYANLIAAARGYALNFRACSGATVSDVRDTQLSALTATTARVTISVGGNDADFAGVMTKCLMPAWMSNCMGAIDTAEGIIRNRLPAALDGLYAEIRSRAPNASVVVVGYPRLFNGRDCHALTWFSTTELSRLNAAADLANQVTARAASARGFGYVDAVPSFLGHAVCDNPAWVNNLRLSVTESFHANAAGHRDGYTPIVGSQLTGSPVVAAAWIEGVARANAAAQASKQRAYAAIDRQIRPARVRPVDLGSRRAERAAERAGVDLSSRASIDRMDRIYAKRQAKQWRQ